VYPLLDLVKDEDVLVRGAAAEAVGRCYHHDTSKIGVVAATKLLEPLLHDHHWLPRSAAVCAIGRVVGGVDLIGRDHILRYDIALVSGVAMLLADTDARVREAASRALLQMDIVSASSGPGPKLAAAASQAMSVDSSSVGHEVNGYKLLSAFGEGHCNGDTAMGTANAEDDRHS